MKASTWKAIFGSSLNPSPVFEAVAAFAEAIADQHRRSPLVIDDINGYSRGQAGTANGPKGTVARVD